MVTIEKKAIKDVANSNNKEFSNFKKLIDQSFMIDEKIMIEGEETIYTESDSEALLNRMIQITRE